MRFENGYLVVGKLWGAPVRLHWSIPLSAFLFSRFRFLPAYWVAFCLLVLVHEVGHAFFVRRYGLQLASINVHGMGGDCRYLGVPSPIQRATIAWGGVLFQGAALVVTLLLTTLAGPPTDSFTAAFYEVFVFTSLWVAAFNLLPIAPLDGAEAWKIVPLLKRRAKNWAQKRAAEDMARAHEKKMERVRKDVEREAKAIDDLDLAATGGDRPGADAAAIVGEALRQATRDVNEPPPHDEIH